MAKARAACGTVGLGVAILLLALMLGAAPPEARAVSVNLDRDPAPERLVKQRARLPQFPRPVFGLRWAIVDRVGGKTRRVPIGPAGDRVARPRVADRNGNGLREVYIEAQAGNSLAFGEMVEWDGRRARTVWKFNDRPLRRAAQGGAINSPIDTRFVDLNGDGVLEVQADATVGRCRACPPTVRYTLVWRYVPSRGRWIFHSLAREGEAQKPVPVIGRDVGLGVGPDRPPATNTITVGGRAINIAGYSTREPLAGAIARFGTPNS